MFTSEIIQSFNNTDLKIYRYIMDHSLEIPYYSIRELAKKASVSTASIIRFCKKLGYDGFNDFKYAYRSSLKKEVVYKQYDFYEVIDCLEKLNNDMYHRQINEAIVLIGNADSVLFFGVGDSGVISKYGARRFSSHGKFSMAIDDPYYQINTIGERTAVVVLSISGETPEVLRVVHECKQLNCKIITITISSQSTLAKISDVVIAYHMTHRKKEFVEFTSQAVALAIVENLATLMMKETSVTNL